MSITKELSDLYSNVSDAYDAIEAKGGEVPQNKNTQNLASSIEGISTTTTWGEIQGSLSNQTDLAEALGNRYTKTEVDNLISTIPTFSVEVVQSLPTEDISDTTIYLVPAEEPASANSYDEYIHINNNWEHIGSTAVDLSNYYTKTEVDTGLNGKQNTLTAGANIQITGNTISATDTTYTSGTGLNLTNGQFSVNTTTIASKDYVDTQLATKANISALPTKTSDLTNDGSDGTSTYVEANELGTVATTNDYTDLDNLPTIDTATSTTSNNAITNSAITTALNSETNARTTKDTALEGDINTINTAINKDVITDLELNSNPSTTVVQLDKMKTNIKTSTTSTGSVALPVASSTQAGVMNSATFNAIAKNTQDIANIIGEVVAVTGLPANPTQTQLTNAWLTASGESTLINGAGIYDVTNTKRWTYYANDTTWHYLDAEGSVQVNTWTNSAAGIVKGSTSAGQIFAESDGTGSVNGWDTLTAQVSTNTSKLSGIETGAEVNVQSDWNQTDASADDYIKNKPTIPTVNNGTLTIQKNGTQVATFTANQSGNATANITVPTKTSDITNDSNFIEQVTVNLTTNWNLYTFTYTGITYAEILAAVKAGKRVLIKASGPLASESNYTTGRWRTNDAISPEILTVTLEFEGKYYDFTFNNSGTDGTIEEKKVKSDNIDWTTLDPSELNRYSTTETPIGVWIDGRTIYRRVFGPITINSTQTWVSHGITNFETIINVYGFFGGSGGDIQPLPKITPDDHNYDLGIGNFYSDRFLIIKGNSLGNTWAYVTLEYIKTS